MTIAWCVQKRHVIPKDRRDQSKKRVAVRKNGSCCKKGYNQLWAEADSHRERAWRMGPQDVACAGVHFFAVFVHTRSSLERVDHCSTVQKSTLSYIIVLVFFFCREIGAEANRKARGISLQRAASSYRCPQRNNAYKRGGNWSGW